MNISNLSDGSIRINKPCELGVVVSGFEVVQPSIAIEVVTPVAKWVDAGHRAGRGEHLAPGVVGVACNGVAACIQYVRHIALQVRDVVVHRRCGGAAALVREAVGCAALVVEELQRLPTVVLRYQRAALPHILVLLIAHRLRQAKPVRIIGVAVVQPSAAVDRAREPPPVRPAKGRPIIPARRVAYRVIADGLPVVGGQKVFPVAVAVGVALRRAAVRDRENVARTIVCVGVGLAAIGLGEQLTLRVVGVSGIRAAAYGRDVAYIVIAVGVAVDAAAVSLAASTSSAFSAINSLYSSTCSLIS